MRADVDRAFSLAYENPRDVDAAIGCYRLAIRGHSRIAEALRMVISSVNHVTDEALIRVFDLWEGDERLMVMNCSGKWLRGRRTSVEQQLGMRVESRDNGMLKFTTRLSLSFPMNTPAYVASAMEEPEVPAHPFDCAFYFHCTGPGHWNREICSRLRDIGFKFVPERSTMYPSCAICNAMGTSVMIRLEDGVSMFLNVCDVLEHVAERRTGEQHAAKRHRR